ncbi:MAG: hypothetical protein AMS20_10000, partial [Gemmatimonas sp. SG8_28]
SIGTLYCWGANQRGQLGVATDELCAEYEIGDWPCALVPMAVSTAERFTHVVGSRPYPRPRAGASDFTCGISTDQRAYCWGSNGDGELGMGFVGDDVGEPQQVAGDVRFLSLSLGDDVACGIATDGLVYCWGNGFGPAPTALPHQWRP